MAKKFNNETLIIGGIAVLAGAFIFKDQICEATNGAIPILCGMGGGGLQARSTPNCNEATNECVCPGGEVFQMGPARTCKDCSAECGRRAKAMYAGYY